MGDDSGKVKTLKTMKKEEVRIGNLVNVTDNEGGEDKVIAIERDDCICYEYGAVNWSMVEGIPLSPDWLIRLGFKEERGLNNFSYPETNGSMYYLNFNDRAKEINAISICHGMIDDTHTAFAWHIKYVHSLQNLMFALTGTELTLKK